MWLRLPERVELLAIVVMYEWLAGLLLPLVPHAPHELSSLWWYATCCVFIAAMVGAVTSMGQSALTHDVLWLLYAQLICHCVGIALFVTHSPVAIYKWPVVVDEKLVYARILLIGGHYGHYKLDLSWLSLRRLRGLRASKISGVQT